MGVNIDSVRKLAESGGPSGMAGMLGGRGAGAKGSTVAAVATKYAHFFTAIVALSQDQEDDLVFNSSSALKKRDSEVIQSGIAYWKEALRRG